jgi:hypothetical protein
VQAAELKRYGITANALAPAARTRMTEGPFAEAMKAPQSGFDVNDPANIAPLVVWLASSLSSQVTGEMFDVQGGRITLSSGWSDGPSVDKRERWKPAEIGPAINELRKQRTPPKRVYGTSG